MIINTSKIEKNINTVSLVIMAVRPTQRKQLIVGKPYFFGFSTSIELNFKKAMFKAIKTTSTLKKVIIGDKILLGETNYLLRNVEI